MYTDLPSSQTKICVQDRSQLKTLKLLSLFLAIAETWFRRPMLNASVSPQLGCKRQLTSISVAFRALGPLFDPRERKTLFASLLKHFTRQTLIESRFSSGNHCMTLQMAKDHDQSKEDKWTNSQTRKLYPSEWGIVFETSWTTSAISCIKATDISISCAAVAHSLQLNKNISGQQKLRTKTWTVWEVSWDKSFAKSELISSSFIWYSMSPKICAENGKTPTKTLTCSESPHVLFYFSNPKATFFFKLLIAQSLLAYCFKLLWILLTLRRIWGLFILFLSLVFCWLIKKLVWAPIKKATSIQQLQQRLYLEWLFVDSNVNPTHGGLK